MENPFRTLEDKLSNLETLVGEVKAWQIDKGDQLRAPDHPFDHFVAKDTFVGKGRQISHSFNLKLERDGLLTRYKIGGKIFYPRKEVEALFEREIPKKQTS